MRAYALQWHLGTGCLCPAAGLASAVPGEPSCPRLGVVGGGTRFSPAHRGPCRAAAAPPPSFRHPLLPSVVSSFLPCPAPFATWGRASISPAPPEDFLEPPPPPPAMEDDQELERKAIEELLKEAKRGKTRAETMGPMGWMKCPLAGTNKRFLINTIKNTLPSHKEQDHEQKEGSKEPGKSQDQKEASGKKYRSHSYKRSLHSSRGSAGCSPPRKRTSRTSRDKCDPRPSRR